LVCILQDVKIAVSYYLCSNIMNALVEFTQKRFKRLQSLLKSFPAAKEKEELHLIRLEIKKIKALLRLIHFNNKDFHDHKHFIPFRTIFRETGTIRDAGLRNELLDHYTQLHTAFFRSPYKANAMFEKNIPAHIKIVEKNRKVILKQIKKIKSGIYTCYLRKKEKELRNLLAEGFNQKDLHALRKLIKEITYLTLVKKKKRKMDPFLIESAELIGIWHDKHILIPWIRTHAPKDKETINKLRIESNIDLQHLRKIVKVYLNK
jgi:CHAD domain-containing protein